MVIRIKPHPCLSKIVDYYWLEKSGKQNIRVLPDGCASIIFNVGKNTRIDFHNNEYLDFSDNILIGPQTRHYDIYFEDENSLYGIKFRQNGAFHFLKTPMIKYKDQFFQLSDVVDGESDDLLKTLLETDGADEVKRALDYYLLIKTDTLLGVSGIVDVTVKKLLSGKNNISITKLSHEAKVTNKHLITLFKKKVGISPKILHRITRFIRVAGIVLNQNNINWSQLAYECNFYDQAHLVNEFKQFSGFSPTQFLTQADSEDLKLRIL